MHVREVREKQAGEEAGRKGANAARKREREREGLEHEGTRMQKGRGEKQLNEVQVDRCSDECLRDVGHR